MAELVSVFLIVLAAQIHHPIPVSNEHLFPFLMTGKVVFFQMILSFEKLLCAKTETNMPVLNIFLPPFQLCLQPGDQLAQTPKIMFLFSVVRGLVIVQSVGCGFFTHSLHLFLQAFHPLLFAEDGSTKISGLRSGKLQTGLVSGFCISDNGVGCPAFEPVFVLEVFGELVQVLFSMIDPGKSGPVSF
ncbi:hypothetical protein [Faecalibaculum rodentium]|uniref:hypothetical protein n=1 Tax=Faecalibaculum rodentium TaxID=1702221 RepID=UPI0023F1406A|nr:hypothetical protein [Faecalibaculum rodentium]